MAGIPAKALREKTDQELQDQMLLEKKRLFDGVIKGASGEAIKPHEKREGRRLIARIRTILRERARRKELDAQIGKLQGQSKDAAPALKRVVKEVEERQAAIKSELTKSADKRKVKPQLKRVRTRDNECNTLADRSAVRLAEALRLKGSLDREDIGQAK